MTGGSWGKELAEIFLGHWLAEQIALDQVAILLLQEAELGGRLHTLGGDLDPQRFAERDDGADDRHRVRVLLHLRDEGAVDLDLVEREALEVAQAGITGAEIVERDP